MQNSDLNDYVPQVGPFQSFNISKRETLLAELNNFNTGYPFEMPSIQNKYQPFSPVYSPMIDSTDLPVLFDSFSMALTAEDWNWQSTEIETEPHQFTKDSFSIPTEIETLLIKDPRGQSVYDLILTDVNFARHMTLIRRVVSTN